MRRLLPMVLFALLTTTLAAGPALADEVVSLKAGYLKLTPKGDFSVDGNGIPGSIISFENDLNFQDSEDYFVEGALNLGPFRLAASYLPLEFSGKGALTRPITFAGLVFPAGTALQSDVTLDVADLELTWNLINFDDSGFRFQLGPEIGAKLIQADVSMTGTALGFSVSAQESADVPLPYVGARTRIGLADFFAIVGRVSYFEYDSNSLLDADAQLEFSPLPMVGIFGGYRYFDINIDDSGVFVDATLDGPYAGAFVRF